MSRRGRALLLALTLTMATAPASGQEFVPPPRDPMMPAPGFLPEPSPGEAPPANAVVREPDFVG